MYDSSQVRAVHALTSKNRVDHLEGLVDLLADLGTGQDDLAANKNEQHNFGLHHAINQTGKQLGFVGAEIVMAAGQPLEADGELDVARPDDVLDLEVGELGVEAELLDDAGVFARRQLGVIFGFGAGDDHLARREDQGRGLGLADAHDDSGEALAQHTVHLAFRRKKSCRSAKKNNQKNKYSRISTFGLYSAFLACRAMVLRSKRQSRLTVATMFLQKKKNSRSLQPFWSAT